MNDTCSKNHVQQDSDAFCMHTVNIRKGLNQDYASREAVNTLCTNLTFLGDDVRRILITSCREHEGKSFLSLSTLMTLAKMGYKTLLIDTDLRRSVYVRQCGMRFEGSKEGLGLAHYLSHQAALEDVVYAVRDQECAYFIPAGHDVANSLSLLSGARFKTLMDEMSKKMDFIIVDTPPIGAIVDAAAVSAHCDGAVIVFSPNLINQREILEAKEQLERANCRILGGVLNKVVLNKTSSRYYYRSKYAAYGTKYYYRRDNEKKK